jgi:hypothetical protein
MAIRVTSILLAASLLAIPAVNAVAQNTVGNGSLSPEPRNANDNPVASSQTRPTDDNPRVPGATGDAIVKGDNSTVAGDRAATAEQRTGVR